MSKNSDHTSVSIADLEPDTGNAAFSTYGFETLDSPVNIRVISYRKLKHDPDGISAKAVIDALVRNGVLADDSSKQVAQVSFESRKSKEEKTVIEIEICP